ncbi:hypothetical protein EGW08_018748 [Elysia chlorotica]|uniref:Laminin G domain-containing protein n=1 Tax=Elysia chlorotica TaxID=188477 RepID=A0A3S0ZAV5_ELYCH|nr:hypothetical protein EGW08_018748 [Elysia chlorotica]
MGMARAGLSSTTGGRVRYTPQTMGERRTSPLPIDASPSSSSSSSAITTPASENRFLSTLLPPASSSAVALLESTSLSSPASSSPSLSSLGSLPYHWTAQNEMPTSSPSVPSAKRRARSRLDLDLPPVMMPSSKSAFDASSTLLKPVGSRVPSNTSKIQPTVPSSKVQSTTLSPKIHAIPSSPKAHLTVSSPKVHQTAPSPFLSLRTLAMLSLTLTVLCPPPGVTANKDRAYFNSSAYLSIPHYTWSYSGPLQVTFRTCSGNGELLSLVQEASSSSSSSSSSLSSLALRLVNGSVALSWNLTTGQSQSVAAPVGRVVSDNAWYRVRVRYQLEALTLAVYGAALSESSLGEVVVANSSYNSVLLTTSLTGTLTIGQGFHGCMFQGPGVDFNTPGLVAFGVDWDTCPQFQGCSSGECRKF